MDTLKTFRREREDVDDVDEDIQTKQVKIWVFRHS